MFHSHSYVHFHHFSYLAIILLKRHTAPQYLLTVYIQPVSLLFSATLKQKSSSLLQNTLVCPYCYQWLQPDNHRIRLRPKKHPSARVQSILRRKALGKRLSLVQKYLLHRFQTSSSVLVRQNTRWLCFVLHCSTLSLQRAQCLICYPLL